MAPGKDSTRIWQDQLLPFPRPFTGSRSQHLPYFPPPDLWEPGEPRKLLIFFHLWYKIGKSFLLHDNIILLVDIHRKFHWGPCSFKISRPNYAKWNQSDRKKTKTVWDNLHLEVSKKCNRLKTIPQKKQTTDTENKLMVTSVGGGQTSGWESWGADYWV